MANILDDTTSRICLDTHPVALSYILIQYATDWESTLRFLSIVAGLQGVNLDIAAVTQLIRETYEKYNG